MIDRAKSNMRKSTCSLEELSSIANGWLGIFDRSDLVQKSLIEAYHSVFICYQRFVEQFSASDVDTDLHKQCFIEDGKRLATTSPVLLFHHRERVSGMYKSKLLQDLRTELARRDGFSDWGEWKKRFRDSDWQLEPDPVIRRRLSIMASIGQLGAEHYRDELRNTITAHLEEEAKRYRKPAQAPFVRQTRLEAFRQISDKYLGRLGFTPVATSLAGYACLDLKLGTPFNLRWAIGDSDDFFQINSPATFRPTLSFRHQSLKTNLDRAPKGSKYLVFPISRIVEGFTEAYIECANAAELEAAISAYSVVIEASLPFIIESIHTVIGKT